MSKPVPVTPTKKSQINLSTRSHYCQSVAWGSSALTVILAIYVWGDMSRWHVSFNAYQLFPLLGLLAFGLMWSHYLASIVRRLLGLEPGVLANYFSSTSMVVLALLFLHPGLLILQRFRDGYGLPPHSYESYVAPGLGWVTLLGSAAWLAFIAYEFRRFFDQRTWWKYVPFAGDIAMLAIVYHGLRLGSNLQTGWYRAVWLLYGLSLVMILGYNYYTSLVSHKKQS